MRRNAIVLATFVAVAVMALPAAAITDGQLDGDEHPAVVLILMEQNGQPAFRCSGTLISATYVLTAGHCAGAPREFSGMRVFTESDVDNGTNNFPFSGPNSAEAIRWAAHPLYQSASFFLHDVGVIELAAPIDLDPGEYGTLPGVNQLDKLKTRRGLQKQTFTAVGYGLQKINPVFVESAKVRMVAYPKLNQIDGGIVGDYSLLLSNNASTGGTCFGDSGGPNFLGDSNVVAGVTSFGMNGNCAGTGGVFRMDRQNVLEFVNGFMADDASGADRAELPSTVLPESRSKEDAGKESAPAAAPAAAGSWTDGGSAVPSTPKGGSSGGADRGGASNGADKGRKLGLAKH